MGYWSHQSIIKLCVFNLSKNSIKKIYFFKTKIARSSMECLPDIDEYLKPNNLQRTKGRKKNILKNFHFKLPINLIYVCVP